MSQITEPKFVKAIQSFFNLSVQTIGGHDYNWHHNIELLWLLNGQIEINLNGKIYNLNKNDLILINSNVSHIIFSKKTFSTALKIHISPLFFYQQGIDIEKGKFALNSQVMKFNPQFNNLRIILASLYSASLSSTKHFEKNALFFRLNYILYKYFFKNDRNRFSSSIDSLNHKGKISHTLVEKVTGYIKEHYSKSSLCLTEAAKYQNYSKNYLSKVFRLKNGINFYEYLERYRLKNAINDLSKSKLKIFEIAYRNGFKETKSFNSMFKNHFALTPSFFRKIFQNKLYKFNSFANKKLEKKELITDLKDLSKIIEKHNLKKLFINPCDYCEYRFKEQKYHNKIEKMKKILNTE